MIFGLLFRGLAVIMSLTPPSLLHAAGDPAFLAAGATPNLLIMIDNSESMLDLAYMPDTGACHDIIDSRRQGISDGARDSGYGPDNPLCRIFCIK